MGSIPSSSWIELLDYHSGFRQHGISDSSPSLSFTTMHPE
jgi:hypothetical protein